MQPGLYLLSLVFGVTRQVSSGGFPGFPGHRRRRAEAATSPKEVSEVSFFSGSRLKAALSKPPQIA